MEKDEIKFKIIEIEQHFLSAFVTSLFAHVLEKF